jgi:hypothetical protein
MQYDVIGEAVVLLERKQERVVCVDLADVVRKLLPDVVHGRLGDMLVWPVSALRALESSKRTLRGGFSRPCVSCSGGVQ